MNKLLRSMANTPSRTNSENQGPRAQTKIAAIGLNSVQVKLDGDSGNNVHAFAVHIRRLAAPGFDSAMRRRQA